MKVSIFGCNGYIGSHLVQFLLNKGVNVHGFGLEDSPVILSPSFKYTQLDITDKAAIDNLQLSCDLLFYFTGVTGTEASITDYPLFIRVNELGLLNILDSIKNEKNHCKKFIFPSTRLVYQGIKNQQLKEDSSKEFKTIYALNKYNGEKYLEIFNKYYNLDYLIGRIGVPYGNIFDSKMSYGTIGFFLNRISSNLPISLYGDGSQKRTFTHVLDICKQFWLLSIDSSLVNESYNISGETFSLMEVAQLFEKKFSIDITNIPWPDLSFKLESGDTVFCDSKIKKAIHFKNETSLVHWVNQLTI